MKKSVNEYGDLGNSIGVTHSSGLTNPGLATFSSPEVSQNPRNFSPVSPNKIFGIPSNTLAGPEEKDIDFIKTKVTPDEVICGMDYEMKRMFYTDRPAAKSLVIQNLKKDPRYYSKLKMLNVDDTFLSENLDNKSKHEVINNIFDNIRYRLTKSQKRVVDERVVNAYKQTVDLKKKKL
jgi:hypothetical protein